MRGLGILLVACYSRLAKNGWIGEQIMEARTVYKWIDKDGMPRSVRMVGHRGDFRQAGGIESPFSDVEDVKTHEQFKDVPFAALQHISPTT